MLNVSYPVHEGRHGRAAKVTGTGFPPLDHHRHPDVEVHLIVRGEIHYLLENHVARVKAGGMTWIPSNHRHSMTTAVGSHVFWSLRCGPELFSRLRPARGLEAVLDGSVTSILSRHIAAPDADRLATLFEMVAAGDDDEARFEAGLAYALLQCWHLYLSSDQESLWSAAHPAVERAAALIRDDPGVQTVAEIAHHAGLTQPRLTRLFREQIGISMLDYRNQQRLQRAVKLYGPGQRFTLQQVADTAGFTSYGHFHRVFKHWMGISPADYARSVRKAAGSRTAINLAEPSMALPERTAGSAGGAARAPIPSGVAAGSP
jgi:AraC-like DNA-binding protein